MKKLLLTIAIIITLFLSFEFLGVSNFMPDTIHNSTITSGLITDKKLDEGNNYFIKLKVIDEKQSSGTREVKIRVPSENVWNLIEIDRTYFVGFQWKNNEVPKLTQIEINDEFAEIYEGKF
ncbi:hypothetical protein [Virgibacillus sp. DJP39]|uniref:hypothetical protein n=1 Tax=Virgibacillus sp. DJP39 TaxID=3409790 RepID=UPI003BB6754A